MGRVQTSRDQNSFAHKRRTEAGHIGRPFFKTPRAGVSFPRSQERLKQAAGVTVFRGFAQVRSRRTMPSTHARARFNHRCILAASS